jgi:hypothetical protein
VRGRHFFRIASLEKAIALTDLTRRGDEPATTRLPFGGIEEPSDMTDRSSDLTLAGIAFLILGLTGLAVTWPKAPYRPDNPSVIAYWDTVKALANRGDG